MKLFGFNITKEKRNANMTYEPTLSNALTFGQMFCNSSAMNISAAYRATEIISDSIAILPIKVKRGSEDYSNHPLNLIFKNGCNNLSKYSLMKLLIQSVILKGNGFAYIERAEDGTAIGLKFLRSEKVEIRYNKKNGNISYRCSEDGYKGDIEDCDMIHLFKNSYDGINGVSVLKYAARSIELANNTEDSASHFFTNGCNLSGVISVESPLNAKQIEDIKRSWSQTYANGGNGIAVLQGNMSYQPIQLNSRDSQLLESRQFNVTDIARFFGISPVLLGDLSHSSYSTIEATQTQFLLHTLQPYITMIEEEFTRKIFKPSENDLEINLDENSILRTDKTAQANYYATLIDKGILSINEARKELGYSEVEGLDKHIMAYTDINQNTINKNNNKEEGAER